MLKHIATGTLVLAFVSSGATCDLLPHNLRRGFYPFFPLRIRQNIKTFLSTHQADPLISCVLGTPSNFTTSKQRPPSS
jgi:hypothetical protein